MLINNYLYTKWVSKNSTASKSNDPKVFNKRQKLFCTVAAICNLVQEFNGLVSTKGSASAGPLVF